MPSVIPYAGNTWTDGVTTFNAARGGTIEQGIKDVSQAPAVRVFHSANQSITSATDTALAFNSERYDQVAGGASTMHDTVTNNSRLTCRYAGVYSITACCQFAANATGARDVKIRLNGTTVIGWERAATSSGTNDVILTAKADYLLAVNDYVEVVVKQDSGGALNVVATGNYSPEFSMVRAA